MERKIYPSDVSDEEWAFVAPYLALMSEQAPVLATSFIRTHFGSDEGSSQHAGI